MISSTQTNQPFAPASTPELTPQSYVDAAITRLRAARLRITQSRVKLLTALGKRGEPMTIEELHEAVGTEDCDLVTVYRCMSAFEDHDVVRRSYRHSGTTLYERKLGEPARYRVVCKMTNRVDEIEPHVAQRLQEAIKTVEDILRMQGYSNVSHLLEFFGIYAQDLRPGQSQAPIAQQ